MVLYMSALVPIVLCDHCLSEEKFAHLFLRWTIVLVFHFKPGYSLRLLNEHLAIAQQLVTRFIKKACSQEVRLLACLLKAISSWKKK
jgi:hypothetical protein